MRTSSSRHASRIELSRPGWRMCLSNSFRWKARSGLQTNSAAKAAPMKRSSGSNPEFTVTVSNRAFRHRTADNARASHCCAVAPRLFISGTFRPRTGPAHRSYRIGRASVAQRYGARQITARRAEEARQALRKRLQPFATGRDIRRTSGTNRS